MLSVMTSDQFAEGGWSDSGYSNPKYDEMYVQQQKEIDPQKRQKIVWEMQEMIFNDRPYIVYWYRRCAAGVSAPIASRISSNRRTCRFKTPIRCCRSSPFNKG